MTQFWVIPFRELYRFLIWWVWVMPGKILATAKERLLDVEDVLVLGETLRLWFAIEPLFGDYTWQGRLIGFLFRAIRLAITILIYLGIATVGLALVIIWLILPVLIVMSIFNLW